ncbi:DUF58 domain-containing protein [Nocardioides sp.]|uniref:DUF58 domain-containing protein n=1 Tax=Nocardioides sp. TaxID=35761 RepID=UPI0035194935
MLITGRVPLLLLLGVGAVVLRPEPGTVWLWLLGVLVLVALDAALCPSPRTVRLARRPGGSVRLGDASSSELTLDNVGRRTLPLLVRDAWQPSAGAGAGGTDRHRLRLRAGERTTLTTRLLPTRRGDLRAAGVTVRVRGPLGLACRQRTFDVPGSVRALPPFGSRRHLPSRLARLRELDGRTAVRTRGQGTEFDSLREYVRGDDVRSIDWRASARSTHVVVRTWQPERDRRVVLVLDTSRTSAGRVGGGTEDDDGTPRLDAAMDAALLLGALASRAGDRVDLVAGDRTVRLRQRLHGVRDVAARMQEQMAGLDPVLAETDWDALAGAVQAFGRQRALVVLLTPLETSAVAEGLLPVLPVLTSYHRVVVASVRDPALQTLATGEAASLEEVYTSAAAMRELTRRERLREVLGRSGVDVVDADAERLPPALADHYLDLKARGLL